MRNGLAAAGAALALATPGLALAQEAPARPFGMMTSPLGDYHMNRDASGTAWQPEAGEDNAPMHHVMSGGWMVMRHATFNLVYDNQAGPRGDDRTFVSGMVMLGASRSFGSDQLNLRAMLSPDPMMGKEGYPLLLATGETADGTSHLIDRQHPHDLIMELSASLSHSLGGGRSVYVYGGLPGEPAFGPPAFMHRQAALDSPEAPISHHWLDSTHVTFGVVTAGYVFGSAKIEASAFKGREPDQHRFDIEAPKLDSWSARLSWNPSRAWSAQLSYADVKSPEQLEPLDDQTRVSASLLYGSGDWAATLAWGGKSVTGGPHTDAYLLEAAYAPTDAWTFFGRAERVEENELGASGVVYPVGKVSIGAIYDVKLNDRVKLGLGGLASLISVPAGLSAAYGPRPSGSMVFLRLKIH